jgi:hypothetical protein
MADTTKTIEQRVSDLEGTIKIHEVSTLIFLGVLTAFVIYIDQRTKK